MPTYLDNYLEQLAVFCKRHNVSRLDAIGSVLTDRFDAQSDVDLIVKFHRDSATNAFEQFFNFKESLSELLGREIDLICERAMRNRHFKKQVECSRRQLYAA